MIDVAWWVWLTIWAALGLGLVALLGLGSWWLFRKFLTLTDDVSELMDTAERLEVGDVEYERPASAVLASTRDIRHREEARRYHRATQKRNREDRRMARARRITSVDASTLRWPASWTSR